MLFRSKQLFYFGNNFNTTEKLRGQLLVILFSRRSLTVYIKFPISLNANFELYFVRDSIIVKFLEKLLAESHMSEKKSSKLVYL